MEAPWVEKKLLLTSDMEFVMFMRVMMKCKTAVISGLAKYTVITGIDQFEDMKDK